jgi:hypothetical protein
MMRLSRERRKQILMALAVAAWLLLLGGISYYLCLPDLRELARNRQAVLDDPNLTWEQKMDKLQEMDANLTPEQGHQLMQIDFKQQAYKRNAEMREFLKMSHEEQAAYLKSRNRPRRVVMGGGGPDGKMVTQRAEPGGGVVFVGLRIGGQHLGKAKIDPGEMQKTMLDHLSPELDHLSPETRAGMTYQRGFSR